MSRKRSNNPNCDPSHQPLKACRKCGLWPPMVRFRWQRTSARWSSWCAGCTDSRSRKNDYKPTRLAAMRRYRASEAGKARRKAWDTSETGRAAHERYNATPRAKLLAGIRRERWRIKHTRSPVKKASARKRLIAYQSELHRLIRRTAS